MRVLKTEGIIIKRVNVGESDRILTVFTKKEGKIQIKAKGVRKISSRRSSHVELLNLSSLTLYNGGRNPILTEASTINAHLSIKNNLRKVGVAYHLCELVNGLCADHQENIAVFNLILNSLERLENEEGSVLIKEFEKDILTLLGFWPKDKEFDSNKSQFFIENILEKRLKAVNLLPLFVDSF